jgi:hypothetical protein
MNPSKQAQRNDVEEVKCCFLGFSHQKPVPAHPRRRPVGSPPDPAAQPARLKLFPAVK